MPYNYCNKFYTEGKYTDLPGDLRFLRENDHGVALKRQMGLSTDKDERGHLIGKSSKVCKWQAEWAAGLWSVGSSVGALHVAEAWFPREERGV